MTDSAIRRVHAAVRIGVTGQGLLRGYPGHGDHSQRQEENDKGAPTTDAVRSLTIHGVPQVRFHGDERVSQSVRSRRHVRLTARALDLSRWAGLTQGSRRTVSAATLALDPAHLGRAFVSAELAVYFLTLILTVVLVRCVTGSLARSQRTV
jgi:hypothetical protein